MKRFWYFVLAAVGLWSGCLKPSVLTPEQFTKEFAEALRKSSPSLTVVIVRDLELKVTPPGGGDHTSFLDNAYAAYKQDPAAKVDVIRRFVAASLDTIGGARDKVDRSRIVPVIKDRPWLEETRQALLSRGAKEVPEHVYEDFGRDLIILYAEDSPQHIRYLTPEDLENTKIERKDLRKVASENLKRLIPKIELHGTRGLFVVSGGGDYDASLLLLDSIWSGGQIKVQGDIVVAIPTRDLLLVTGSREVEGIKRMKQLVQKSYSEGSYRLTPKLFVYSKGAFAEFTAGAEPNGAVNASSSHP